MKAAAFASRVRTCPGPGTTDRDGESPCEGPFSGSPVRTDSTTSWIARVTAAAFLSHSSCRSLRNRGTPSGFAKPAAPVMARAMKGAMTKDLARLEARLRQG